MLHTCRFSEIIQQLILTDITMKEDTTKPSFKPNDHLANERTYLAWIRTGIGIMAFGFVVVKFSLFVKQIGLFLGADKQQPAYQGYSALIGILLVAIGILFILLSFLQYRRVEKQLADDAYVPSTLLTTLLTGVIFLVAIVLVAYLVQSI
jgi:putative membrane protein